MDYHREPEMKQAFIFDLDGVVVDTARYHCQAWKELAETLGFELPESVGEHIKGVSRMDSLEIVLAAGRITGLSDQDKMKMADKKNSIYQRLISNLSCLDILPGIAGFLKQIREEGYGTALGSASRSGNLILKRLEIRDLFDVVVDGCSIRNAKPDPEVFLKAAEGLGTAPGNCIVVEDAAAGVTAAKNSGMHCIGIGEMEVLIGADLVLKHTGLLLQADYRGLFAAGDV